MEKGADGYGGGITLAEVPIPFHVKYHQSIFSSQIQRLYQCIFAFFQKRHISPFPPRLIPHCDCSPSHSNTYPRKQTNNKDISTQYNESSSQAPNSVTESHKVEIPTTSRHKPPKAPNPRPKNYNIQVPTFPIPRAHQQSHPVPQCNPNPLLPHPPIQNTCHAINCNSQRRSRPTGRQETRYISPDNAIPSNPCSTPSILNIQKVWVQGSGLGAGGRQAPS